MYGFILQHFVLTIYSCILYHRSVNDGTAKELLGEQFKRRLLMDGQYGNVFFVCTQTDDIEPTETMRDHADVAQKVPGRWEKMSELKNDITNLKMLITEKLQQQEDLEGQFKVAMQQHTKSLADLQQCEKSLKSQEKNEAHDVVKADIVLNKAAAIKAKQRLEEWQRQNCPIFERLQNKCGRLQMKLKPLCAAVRNEYSKSRLQEDFRSGLEELYEYDDNDERRADMQTALPGEFNMDVFCTSANDYLKLMKIKRELFCLKCE